MEGFAVVLLIAILVEAIVQVIKGFVPADKTTPGWLWPVVSAAMGILVCVLAGVDALALLGVALAIPYVGSVLTGVLVSRGASFVHDLWNKINGQSVTEIPVDVHIEGMTVVEDDKPPDAVP